MPDLTAVIVLEARNLAGSAINDVRAGIEGLTGAATGARGALGGIMQGIELGAGIAAFQGLTSAITEAATSSVKFQTMMTELQNNTRLMDGDMKGAQDTIRGLSTTYGVATESITTGYRHVIDIVQNAAASQEILNVAVEGSAAAGANAANVANVLAGIMHEYGTDVVKAADGTVDLVATHESAIHTLGVMTRAAQDSNSTLESWTGSMSAAVGMAAAMGQPLENMGAIFGSLTLHGFPDNANAGTQVKDMLIQLAHLTPAATEELTRLGKASGVDVVNDLKMMNEGTMTFVDFIGHLRDAFAAAGLTEAQFRIESERLIAGQRGGLALAALVTTGYNDMNLIQKDLSDQTKVNTVVDETWNRTKDTASKQWDILKEQVSNFGIALGSNLLPAITPVVKAMNDDLPAALHAVGGAFQALNEGAQGALQAVANSLAATGADWAPWAAQAGDAGVVVDKALSGTSAAVQALQFLLQGNWKAAWTDAQASMKDFGDTANTVFKILDDHKDLIVGVGAAFGAWAVLGTVVPAIVGAGEAIAAFAGGITVWMAAMVPAEGALGAMVAALGGPVTIAIAGAALAVGALAAAWVNNWGDIQGTTQTAVGDLKHWLDDLGAALSQHGAVDDLREAWKNLQDAGVILWGLVKDAFAPAQKDLNATLSGGPGAGDKSADNFAQSVKDLTGGLRDATQMVKDALNFIEMLREDYKTANLAAAELALTIHNELIREMQASLDPLQKILDMLHDFEIFAEKTYHIKIDIPGVEGIQAALNSIHTVASSLPASGVGGPGGIPNASAGSDAALLRPSQFSDPQLSADEALAACGPAALVAFMRANGGKVPTLREAANMAMTPAVGGWNTNQGMVTGVVGERNLLSAYGLDSTINQAPSVQQIQSGANAGTGEIIDTLHHFFTATGYNPDTGQYSVGTSGSDLRGAKDIPGSMGGTLLTLDQMIGLEGQVVGILTDIKGNTGKVADSTAVSGGSASKDDLIAYARAAAERSGISPDIFQRQIQQESGFDPTRTSSAGAIGIAQFMPGTARSRGVDPKDPLAALDAAAQYDAELLQKYGGNWEKALAAYNAGEGHVDSGTPNAQQTSDYLNIILGGSQGTGSFASAGGAFNTAARPTGPAVVSPDDQAAIAAGRAFLDAGGKTAKIPELAQLTNAADTAGDYLTTRAAALTKTEGGYDRAATAATAKVDTNLASQLGEDLTGQTSGSMLAQKQVNDDIKARKDAMVQQIQDETTANNIKVAADELAYKRQEEDQQTAASRAREDDSITNNIQLAHEALIHSRTLEDTEIQYQHGLQLEATAHARKLEDAKIVADNILADQATQHARALEDSKIQADQKLQDQATVHARTLQDQQIVVNQQLQADATLHAQQLAQEQTLVTRQLANAQLLHQRALEDAQIQPNEQLSGTATAHSRGLQDQDTAYALQQTQIRDAAALQVSLAKATSDAQRQQINDNYQANVEANALQARYAAEDLAHKRQEEDQEAAYQQQLAATALAKQRALQDAENQYQANIADQNVVAANARAQTEADYQAGLASQALALSRKNADIEAGYQRDLAVTALDLSRQNADVETAYQRDLAATALTLSRKNADIEQDYKDGLAQQALQHSRALQDAEVQYQIGIAHTALMAKRADEDAVRADARAKEDADIQHKIVLDQQAAAFARAEKAKQDELDKTLADEAYARQVEQLKSEAAIQKQNIASNLLAQKIAAVEQYQTDVDAHQAAFDKDAAQTIAKAKTAVEAAGGDFAPIEASMTAAVTAMDAAFQAAHDTSAATLVDLAGQAADALAKDGTMPLAMIDSGDQATATFGDGGTVPGAFGDTGRALDQAIRDAQTSLGTGGKMPSAFAQAGVSARAVFGDGGQIVNALQLSDRELGVAAGVAANAMGDGGTVPKALEKTGSTANAVLGDGGTLPKAAKAASGSLVDVGTSADNLAKNALQHLQTAALELKNAGLDPASAAADALNTAIQAIKDKQITVNTVFQTNGSASGGGGGGGSSGGSSGGGSQNLNSTAGQPGSFTLPNIQTGGSITVQGNNLGDAINKAAAATGVTPQAQAGGGTFGNNTQGGLSLQVGGITTQDVAANLHAHEAVIPLDHLGDVLRGIGGVLIDKAAIGQVTAQLADTFKAPPPPPQVAAPVVHPPITFSLPAPVASQQGTGGMTDAQMLTLARMIADELRGVSLNVGVDTVHSALLQKERRSGKLWTR